VVAASVGGLRVAVADRSSGLLVDGHAPAAWADALAMALRPELAPLLSAGAVEHAGRFSWDRTTDALVDEYTEATLAFRRALLDTGVAV
jgi:D-inositol-3-phosphate glycosyltransferase